MSGAVHLVNGPLTEKPTKTVITSMPGSVLSVAFAPKRHRLLVGYGYHPEQPALFYAWELTSKGTTLNAAQSYKALSTNEQMLTLLVSRDEATVLKVRTNRAVVLKKEANNRTFRIQGWIPPDEGRTTCAAMSADGRWAVLGEEDGLVSLWDLETRKEVAEMDGCMATANCVAFSGDGRFAAAGCEDGTPRVENGAVGVFFASPVRMGLVNRQMHAAVSEPLPCIGILPEGRSLPP